MVQGNILKQEKREERSQTLACCKRNSQLLKYKIYIYICKKNNHNNTLKLSYNHKIQLVVILKNNNDEPHVILH